MDISAWLRELGLERYEQAFHDNQVDARSLPHLTADDLKDMGVTAIGHRRLLLQAIAQLGEPPRASDEARPEAAAAETSRSKLTVEAERRQLTVMFVDLVGSTELTARLDPEDMGQVIRTYHGTCTEVVERWGGHVARYMGDGVLAYSGWPQAHEDDAGRTGHCRDQLGDPTLGWRVIRAGGSRPAALQGLRGAAVGLTGRRGAGALRCARDQDYPAEGEDREARGRDASLGRH